jgi:polar amino acid transport system substrate-binding protein
MRNLLLATAAFLALALPGFAHAQAPACKGLQASGNPQYPPYLWRNPADADQLIGANQALMQWLSKEIGLPIEVRYVGPWSRVQEEARSGRIDLIAGAFFTLPRTEYMDYVFPPFRETRSVVLVREGSKLRYSRWADLQGKEGITVVNNSFGEEFDRFMLDKLKFTRVASLEQGLRMLEIGRGAFMLYEDSPAEAYIASLGVKGLKALQPPVAQERLHLTLSHKSACNTPELRGALTRAMYKLQREGLMAGFVKEGVQRWKDTPAASDGK